jgi:hypothetical protein
MMLFPKPIDAFKFLSRSRLVHDAVQLKMFHFAKQYSSLSFRAHNVNVPTGVGLSSKFSLCRAMPLNALLRWSASRSLSSSSERSRPAGSNQIIFQPALTIPKALRVFAVSQAAFCFINGAALALLRNPLSGGTFKSVCCVRLICFRALSS